MFTGIIEAIGTIRALTPKGGDVRVLVETGKLDLGDVKLGDSIAVNGVCLTAVELPGNGFWADVSRETRRAPPSSISRPAAGSTRKALTPPAASVAIWSAATSTVSARSWRGKITPAPCSSASVRRASWPSTLR